MARQPRAKNILDVDLIKIKDLRAINKDRKDKGTDTVDRILDGIYERFSTEKEEADKRQNALKKQTRLKELDDIISGVDTILNGNTLSPELKDELIDERDHYKIIRKQTETP